MPQACISIACQTCAFFGSLVRCPAWPCRVILTQPVYTTCCVVSDSDYKTQVLRGFAVGRSLKGGAGTSEDPCRLCQGGRRLNAALYCASNDGTSAQQIFQVKRIPVGYIYPQGSLARLAANGNLADTSLTFAACFPSYHRPVFQAWLNLAAAQVMSTMIPPFAQVRWVYTYARKPSVHGSHFPKPVVHPSSMLPKSWMRRSFCLQAQLSGNRCPCEAMVAHDSSVSAQPQEIDANSWAACLIQRIPESEAGTC